MSFASNISININLIKVQICKIIQSGGSFDFWLANLERKALENVATPLIRDNLSRLLISLL